MKDNTVLNNNYKYVDNNELLIEYQEEGGMS